MSKHEASAREHIFGRVPSATGAVVWHKNDQRVVTMCYEVAARVLDARSRDRISFAVARCDTTIALHRLMAINMPLGSSHNLLGFSDFLCCVFCSICKLTHMPDCAIFDFGHQTVQAIIQCNRLMQNIYQSIDRSNRPSSLLALIHHAWHKKFTFLWIPYS